jgi:hypothetical protein
MPILVSGLRRPANADNYCKMLIAEVCTLEGKPFEDPGKEQLWCRQRPPYGNYGFGPKTVIDVLCTPEFRQRMIAVGLTHYPFQSAIHSVRPKKGAVAPNGTPTEVAGNTQGRTAGVAIQGGEATGTQGVGARNVQEAIAQAGEAEQAGWLIENINHATGTVTFR